MSTFAIEQLFLEDLEEVAALQQRVVEYLKDESLYVPSSTKEFEAMLGEKGLAVGAKYKGDLVGFFMAFFPAESSKNLGLDIGLEKEAQDEVVHLECVVVEPKYRGHQLQQKMGQVLIQRLRNQGRARYLMATVSPYNPHSLSNLLSMGLLIVAFKEKYNNVLRYILLKDIKDDTIIEDIEPIVLAGEAIAEQMLWLERGYLGIGLDRVQDGVQIRYVKYNKV
jgi:GNAT superfamily N-acetyltransferase